MVRHCNIRTDGDTNRPPGVPIPPDLEIDLFLNTVNLAIELSDAGDPERGASELAYGRDRVTAALRDGEPWAPEMLRRYQDALTNYCFTHRVRPPESGPPDAS